MGLNFRCFRGYNTFHENFQHPRSHAHTGLEPRNLFNENFVDSYISTKFKFREIKALYGMRFLTKQKGVPQFKDPWQMHQTELPVRVRSNRSHTVTQCVHFPFLLSLAMVHAVNNTLLIRALQIHQTEPSVCVCVCVCGMNTPLSYVIQPTTGCVCTYVVYWLY